MTIDYVTHITPVGDEKRHYEKITFLPHKDGRYCPCHCLPTEEVINNELIVTHNSFDGRQGVENANKILKNKSRN